MNSFDSQARIRYNLDEVSFIRPILILLVVLYHSMAIHTGNWELPDGCTDIPAYKAIGRLAYAFMLEAFVFVSGYVWAYQRETRGRKDDFLKLCRKKAIRLILPTILFGLIYCYLFEGGVQSILVLLEGPGHLWFLPMLFECFMISWCVLYTKVSIWLVLPILFLIGLFIPSGLPLRISYTLYYLPFFLLGYCLYSWYDKFKAMLKKRHVFEVWALFFVVYFGMVFFRSWLVVNVNHPQLLTIGNKGCMFFYSTVGTIALLLMSIWLTNRIHLTDRYVKLGSFCMGVYIFQQFILEIIYYHTIVPLMVPNWSLPLIGFFMALFFSLVLTYLLRITNIGKSLL